MFKSRILRKSAEQKIYPYQLIKEISTNKFSSKFFHDKGEVKNEVYNTINALEKSGYIKLSSQSKSPRSKNYYVITKKGKDALRNSRKIFASGVKELSKMLK